MAVATPNYVFVAREVNTYVTVCLLQERSTPNCACVCYKRGQHPCICAQLQEKSTQHCVSVTREVNWIPNCVPVTTSNCVPVTREVNMYPTVCLLMYKRGQHPNVYLLQERSTPNCVPVTREVNIQLCACYKGGQHLTVSVTREVNMYPTVL